MGSSHSNDSKTTPNNAKKNITFLMAAKNTSKVKVLSTLSEKKSPSLDPRSLASVNHRLNILPNVCLDHALWELFKYIEHDVLEGEKYDRDHILKCLEKIERQARQEEVSGCVFSPNLRHVKRIVTNQPMDDWDSEKIADLLYCSIKDIHPVDFELLVDLIAEGEVLAETLMGKDVLSKYLEKRYKTSMYIALKNQDFDLLRYKIVQLKKLAAMLNLDMFHLELLDSKKMVDDECLNLLLTFTNYMGACENFEFAVDKAKVILAKCITIINTLGALDKLRSEFCLEDSEREVNYRKCCYDIVLETQQKFSDSTLVLFHRSVPVCKFQADMCSDYLAMMRQICEVFTNVPPSEDDTSIFFEELSTAVLTILKSTTRLLDDLFSDMLKDLNKERNMTESASTLNSLKNLLQPFL